MEKNLKIATFLLSCGNAKTVQNSVKVGVKITFLTRLRFAWFWLWERYAAGAMIFVEVHEQSTVN